MKPDLTPDLAGSAQVVTHLGLPQIRTCPFGASGSSSQGLTIRLATRGGSVHSGLGVPAPAELPRHSSLTRHLPSLPRVLAVRVPLVHRYYEGVRRPAPLSPRSWPPLGDTTVALAVRSQGWRAAALGLELVTRCPAGNDTVETAGPPKFLENPDCFCARFFDSGRTARPSP